MTVVHLVPAMEQGGVESVVCDLNRVLVKAGHASVVISKGGRLVDRIVADGGRHIALDLKTKNPLTAPWRARQLRKVLQEFCVNKTPTDVHLFSPPIFSSSPILVIAHSRVPAWLFVLGSRSLSLPFFTFAHGANSVSRYSAVMTKGDRVLCPSHFLEGYLKKNYDFDHSRIRVLHPAVDSARFDPERLDRAFMDERRGEWGLKEGKKVLMALGRVSPVKGYDALIRDFAGGKYPFEKLVIVGGADLNHVDHLAKLQLMVADLGIDVVFAGQQEKVPECLALADAVVSSNTTKPESFGLSVVEAFAMNRPVFAKRFGGVAEIFSEVEAWRGEHAGSTLRDAAVALYGVARFAARVETSSREAVR